MLLSSRRDPAALARPRSMAINKLHKVAFNRRIAARGASHDPCPARARHCHPCGRRKVSGEGTQAAPKGGLARMSRRVMNLAHIMTQNGRRLGDRTGFVWGERAW